MTKRNFLIGFFMVAAGLLFSGMPDAAALTNRYVVKGNPTAAAPYDTPFNAAAAIQTAIDYAFVGETVLVAAATYDSGGILLFALTNRIWINKAITVQSLDNNPSNTIIQGAFHPGTTNGPAATRCVRMSSGARLVGFTLTNGATLTAGDERDLLGGGVYCGDYTGIVSNCIVTGNSAHGGTSIGGGGAYLCTLYDSVLAGNKSFNNGGGAGGSKLYRCRILNNHADNLGGGVFGIASLRGYCHESTVSGNRAGVRGGGLCGCEVFGSTIVNNQADMGGGIYDSISAENCQIISNSATSLGGGAMSSYLRNCDLLYNVSPQAMFGGAITNGLIAYNGGAGVQNAHAKNCTFYGNSYAAFYSNPPAGLSLVNCTIVGNRFGILIEGTGYANIVNSIVYSNIENWRVSAGNGLNFTNTCAAPEYAGWHASNLTNDPRFVAYGAGYTNMHIPGNYRLQPNSPCVNTGTNEPWMANQFDMDRRPRIKYGVVDMGAYETIYVGSIFAFY